MTSWHLVRDSLHLNVSNQFLLELESFQGGDFVLGQKSEVIEMREKTDTAENWFIKVLLGLLLGLLSFILLTCKTDSSLMAFLVGLDMTIGGK